MTYVVLIGPVDYFVLKRMKHLEWTWFTFPAIALAATLVAFWTISVSRKARIYVNQLTVADWSADGKSQRSLDMAVLLSPVHHRYNVSFSGPARNLYLDRRAPASTACGMSLTSSHVRDDGRLRQGHDRAADTHPACGAPHFRRRGSARPRTVEPPLSVSLVQEAGILAGSVTNSGNSALTNVLVVHSTGVYAAGSQLKPGDTFQVSAKGRVKFDRWCGQVASSWTQRCSTRRARVDSRECAMLRDASPSTRAITPPRRWAGDARPPRARPVSTFRRSGACAPPSTPARPWSWALPSAPARRST